MKQIQKTALLILMLLCLTACAEKSALQQATGASQAEADAIVSTLADHGVSIASIKMNDSLENGEGWAVYDVVSEDERSYLLVLGKDTHEFAALLDENDAVVYGLIDNGIFPGFDGKSFR